MKIRTLIVAIAVALVATLVPASPAHARPAPLAEPTWVGSYQDVDGDDFQIVYGPKGSLIVSNADRAAIQLFNRKGQLVRSVGGVFEDPPFNFASPRGITIDSRNRVYVADTGRGRIVILDTALRYLGEWDIGGGEQVTFPQRVKALSDGTLLITYTEQGGASASIFTAAGRKLRDLDIDAIGPQGPGGFSTITAIAIDDRDRIWMTQSLGQSTIFAVFAKSGAYLGGIPIGREFFNDMVFDDQGIIHGARRSFDAPFKAAAYSTQGQLLVEYLPNGSEPEQSLFADSIAVDRSGKVVVADRSGEFDVFRFATCGGRFATQIGTAGNDTLIGTRADDTIIAGGGNDAIATGPGDDIICAGSGNDRVNAGTGNDIIAGQAGDDILLGKVGRDLINGGPGTDACGGGAGRDRAVACETEVSIP